MTTVTKGGDQGDHQVINMDGDKNGGHNGQGPGPAKPDPQEANNSDNLGRFKTEMDRIFQIIQLNCAPRSMLKACSNKASSLPLAPGDSELER